MTNLSDILPPSNVVTDSSTDTLTNKTLTSPKVNEDVAVTSTATELNLLDGVTATTAELNILDGVTSTAAELNILDGVTSTAAELNILDGVTSTAAELNILDGVTSTATELNLLDGVTSTTAELNILDGVTSTAAELNALDGITAVVGELNALDIGSTAVGTAVASKAVILDSNKDYTGMRNLTISGELDAATLDISGNADIDGTLETDNLTIGGAQGSDGQILTSTGSGVGWESPAAGGTSGYQFLESVSVSANSSTIEIDELNTSDYAAYKIFGNLRTTGSSSQARFTFRSGTSDVGSHNNASMFRMNNNATAYQGGYRVSGSSYLDLGGADLNQYTVLSFGMDLYIPLSYAEFSGYNKRTSATIRWAFEYSGVHAALFGEAWSTYDGIVNGMKLYLNTGTYADGIFYVYGLKNSA